MSKEKLNIEEKLETIKSKDICKLVEYYETYIGKLNLEFSNDFNILKYNLDQIGSNSHKSKSTQVKGAVSNLLKHVEQLQEQISKLKKFERMNFVYQRIINNFSNKISDNKVKL